MSCALRGSIADFAAMGQAPYPKNDAPTGTAIRRIEWNSFIGQPKSYPGTKGNLPSLLLPISAAHGWKTPGIASPTTTPERNTSSTLSELAEYPLICLGEQTKTFDFYSEFFKQNGVVFSPSVEAATADQIMPLVMHDLGIGFVPMKSLENVKEANSVHILHLEETIPTRSICLVKRTGTSLSIAAKKLEEMILEAKTIK